MRPTRFVPLARWAAASLLALCLLDAQAQVVHLQTTEGDIRLELDAEKAPKSVANFIQYVKSGHYNGTIFHRVIEGFMIQSGGYDIKLNQRPTKPPIPLESQNGLSNLRGSIAMARTSDPNSATSQFFINVADNPGLDSLGGGYAVFGRVIEGMDVVDKIRVVETGSKGLHQNLPVNPILINKATVESTKK